MKISVIGKDKGEFKPVVIDGPGALVTTITEDAYSLATYKDNHRIEKNFIESDFIGLDFDDGYTLEQAKEAFKDHWHIIGTTKSHQVEKNGKPACDRFRVILKADKTIDNYRDYKATVKALLKDFPEADQQCSDASRFFYKCHSIESVNDSGKLQPVKKYEKPETHLKEVAPYMKGQVALDTLKFITFGAPSGSWNHVLFKAAIDLHEQQYSQEEAISLLSGATRNYEGELDESDLRTIQSAYEREPEHAPRKVESMFDFKSPGQMSKNKTQVNWLVDGIMGEGAISIFAAAPKCGKSTLSRQLAVATARGGEWLGRRVRKSNVLYLALEEEESMFNAQMRHIGMEDQDNIFIHTGRPFPGNVKENLTQAIQSFDAGLVIIDTLLLLTNFNDINSYNEAYKELNPFRELARETKAHILMIHHTNKSGTMMGSQGLLGAVDCGIIMNYVLGDNKRRQITSQQRGGAPFSDMIVEYNKEHDIYVKASQEKPLGF